MSWQLLPTNYTDVSWAGLKKYQQITNPDGTVSFQDVTQYTDMENSFFGALDANRMNEALNTLMSMVEDGTDLYSSFQNYFNLQKGLFEDEADAKQSEFTAYIANLEAQGDSIINELQTGYRTEMNDFKEEQENLFNTWFEFVKGQLGTDVAGNLQNEIDQLDIKTDGFISRETVFSETGDTITETYGDKSVTTEFVSDSVIVQKLYVSGVLTSTKTITFSADGSTITEVV